MKTAAVEEQIGLDSPAIDGRIRRRFFKDAPETEVHKFNEFIRLNPKRIYRGRSGKTTAYCVLGEGPKTLFVPAAGMGFLPSELGFQGLSRLALTFRVICPDPVITPDLTEIVETYDGILKSEGAERIFLYGSSGSGLAAQVYFKQRFDRVDRLVLANTIALSPDRVRSFIRDRSLTKLLPSPLIQRILLKAGGKLLKAQIPPELRGRMEFLAGLTRYMIVRHYSKPKLLAVMDMMTSFAAQGGLAGPDYSSWPGKVLIITAEADPGFKYAPVLKAILPQSQTHIFGKQYGHIVAYLAEDEYYGVIERFLR